MMATVRYECRECGRKWSRQVSTRVFLVLDRLIAAICPGCAPGEEE